MFSYDFPTINEEISTRSGAAAAAAWTTASSRAAPTRRRPQREEDLEDQSDELENNGIQYI